ncbi:hypothetical protein C2845_PM01G22950 [Panicum miliaceum]|uniref:Uncharacterized protein n=1 Tax=Panicum miliaceum TaxID=4540 RepID=A0A3L6TJM2_PANMI|nr:hypothetical protein C2845_PM01G22950 [Panicum miliaceum]
MVVAFRNWFRKYCKHQVGWGTPQVDQLPPSPTKDKLLERYWSHVVQCTSCIVALKAMKALEVSLRSLQSPFLGCSPLPRGRSSHRLFRELWLYPQLCCAS